jgi:hypothetical protein
MVQIPFGAFPPAEKDALCNALRELGLPVACVCVSRMEWPGSALLPRTVFATITSPWLCRTYEGAEDARWIEALKRDLRASVRSGTEQAA